jgi:hypothetical protein
MTALRPEGIKQQNLWSLGLKKSIIFHYDDLADPVVDLFAYTRRRGTPKLKGNILQNQGGGWARAVYRCLRYCLNSLDSARYSQV